MQEFVAVNEKQLGICLKMLYAEHVTFFVELSERTARKIDYHVRIEESDDVYRELLERFRILTS